MSIIGSSSECQSAQHRKPLSVLSEYAGRFTGGLARRSIDDYVCCERARAGESWEGAETRFWVARGESLAIGGDALGRIHLLEIVNPAKERLACRSRFIVEEDANLAIQQEGGRKPR